MAEANKTLINRAEVTSIVTPATKRFALVMDGQTVELGNTGWRDISGLLQNVVGPITAGMLLVIRAGNTVTYKISCTPSINGNALMMTAGIGAAFAPDATLFDQGRGGAPGVSTGGSIYINPAVAGQGVAGLITFVTDNAWPTLLPGVPLGDPVVV